MFLRNLFTCLLFVLFFYSTSAQEKDGSIITYINSLGNKIAVRIEVPEKPRYDNGAPVVVEVGSWFISFSNFKRVNDTKLIGAVTLSLVWPGQEDKRYGVSSEGTFDYGGPVTLKAIRDLVRFATGEVADINGKYLTDHYADAIPENTGLFASSHSGVIATNAIAYYGSEMPKLKYFVGRENPTRDEMYPLEIGHWDKNREAIQNPFYNDDNFHPKEIDLDCSTVGWYDDGKSMPRPYFAAKEDKDQHILHPQICPKPRGKRYYSRAVINALKDNGALDEENWPEGLATPGEVNDFWDFRITVHNYSKIKNQLPDLKVMLVFADDDHVQTAIRKPHIHQAWEGFRYGSSLWVRMNCDRAYSESIDEQFGALCPDNPANEEPEDWVNIRDWGFPAGKLKRQDIWLASVAEMADRVHYMDWSGNLSETYEPVLIDAGSGVEEDAERSMIEEIKIFPNPSYCVIEISSEVKIFAEIMIYNIFGEVMIKKDIHGKNLKIDTAGLPAGIYFIAVNNNLYKFIKAE